MKIPFKKDPTLLTLYIILATACVLRFYGLTHQSMWVDELHTMNEADPSRPWSDLFYFLKHTDPHPPLYFIFERILFSLFGHTEGVARGLSAICGVISVWGMYLLGKELLNQRLGIIAAWLTCVNYFNIFYSQEARGYIMAFLFAVFSTLYFIKLIKRPARKLAYTYSLFTLLLLYTHYYSLFIVAAQGIMAFILMFGEHENRKQFLTTFAIAGVIMVVGYSPWIPQVVQQTNVTSFWISPIQPSFATSFFYTYFGNFELLNPLLILLLIYYCAQVFSESNSLSLKNIKESPLQLSFFFFLVTLLMTYLVPYIRSVKVVPMLFDRYTIVVVPFFLVAIAFGIALIRNRVIQIAITSTVVLLSLTDFIVNRRYYKKSTVSKTQFREVTKFIKDSGKVYPIVEEKTYWQHDYYLKQFNYNVEVFPGNKEATIDSILQKTSIKYDLRGFWIVGAHGNEPHLAPEVQQRLDSAYTLVKQAEYFDAWTELYISNDRVQNVTGYFPGIGDYYYDKTIPLWGGAIVSQPIFLSAGKYELRISHMGTIALNEYPHLIIYINDKKLMEFYTSENLTENKFAVDIPSDSSLILKIDFDNDAVYGNEDRNAFIKSVIFELQE